MKITKAIRSDAKELTELTIRSKSHWNYDEKQIEDWREELTITEDYIKQNEIYKLSKKDCIIGYYAYVIENRNSIKLDSIFIDPPEIGKGYGKFLMNDFLARIKKSEFNLITLEADPHAAEFYIPFGFHVVGKLETSIKDRYLPIMELRLD